MAQRVNNANQFLIFREAFLPKCGMHLLRKIHSNKQYSFTLGKISYSRDMIFFFQTPLRARSFNLFRPYFIYPNVFFGSSFFLKCSLFHSTAYLSRVKISGKANGILTHLITTVLSSTKYPTHQLANLYPLLVNNPRH